MRRVLWIGILIGLVGLVACSSSSPEKEELVEYHNNYVNAVNEKAMQVDKVMQASFQTESPKEALVLQKEEIIPLVKEIEDYIHSQNPATDVVKSLNKLRVDQLETWQEAIELRYAALKKTVKVAEEDVIDDLITQSNEKLEKALEKGKVSDKRFKELAETYKLNIE